MSGKPSRAILRLAWLASLKLLRCMGLPPLLFAHFPTDHRTRGEATAV
jgi:hypothetical protein